MPGTRTNRLKRAQQNRKNPGKGKQPERGLSQRNVSGGIGRTSSSTAPGLVAGSYFLNPKLKDVSPLELNAEDLFRPEFNSGEDRMPLGDVSVWVPALYNCLKQIPSFKDDAEWVEMPSVHDVARYLIKKVKTACPKDFQWVFARDRNDQLILTYYVSLGQYDNGNCLCVEWIQKFETEDPKLAKLALEMISKVAVTWCMDIIHTEYIDQIAHDPSWNIDENDDEFPMLVQQCMRYIDKGDIAQFADRVRRIGKNVSLPDLRSRTKKLNPKSHKEKLFKDWMLSGIAVLENPATIGQYMPPDFIYDEFEIPPITINEMFSIHWSIHDPVFKNADSLINQLSQETGIIPPIVSFQYGEKKAGSEKFRKEQVELLATFMRLGRKFYFDYYDDFFENVYRNPEYESTLIHILQ